MDGRELMHPSKEDFCDCQSNSKPVAWQGYDLDSMVEAFNRVIEAYHNSNHPFHNPIDADARMALRILRGFIPEMKSMVRGK